MNNTRRYLLPAAFALFLAAAFAGCSGDEIPWSPEAAERPVEAAVKSADGGLINNFEVRFDGRTAVGGDTRFSWTVRGTGVEPALSHFMVQLPPCAPDPVAFEPSHSVSINTNPNTGIYGVEWHLSVEADDSVGRQFSIIFPGDVPLGEIHASVISGNETGVGIIPGPCQGYEISGRVFVDANENGLRDPDEESGIANVLVELVDEYGNVQAQATDEFGDYSFRKLEGSFTVQLGLADTPGYFNGSLTGSFDPTTVLTRDATVPPDAAGNDFGFSPRSDEIILDLETGILLSDGQSLKFWKSVFRTAASNGRKTALYDNDVLLGYLNEIQGLFLADPYAFTPGNELQEAFDILRTNSHEPVDELLAELLATELNHVAGRGLVGQEDLQLVLIAWGEALIAEARAPAVTQAAPLKGRRTGDDLSIAAQLFELINTGGGGGVDE